VQEVGYMQRRTYRSLVYYQFPNLVSDAGLVHGLFTRLGGQSTGPWTSLNTGHTVGDDPQAVEANHGLICEALRIERSDIVSPHQVHSATVRVVDREHRGRVCPETDALITACPNVLLMLRFADCVPVLLYDPCLHVVGLAHAGWRGTADGIASATVQAMAEAFGSCPSDIVAGVGPAIGPCCYEVGDDVAEAFHDTPQVLRPAGDGHWHLDLWATNREQLTRSGVREVHMANTCTACHTDEWFSHRAERGRTGRWGALIGLRVPGDAKP
jgi:purine-nucleoside/S-methyl-5'-thioadenosine phosphorylase / adenosine deaminase